MTPGFTSEVGARAQNLELFKLLLFIFFRCSYLDSHWPESSDTWTKGNMESLMRPDPDVFMPIDGAKGQNLVRLLRTEFLKFL